MEYDVSIPLGYNDATERSVNYQELAFSTATLTS